MKIRLLVLLAVTLGCAATEQAIDKKKFPFGKKNNFFNICYNGGEPVKISSQKYLKPKVGKLKGGADSYSHHNRPFKRYINDDISFSSEEQIQRDDNRALNMREYVFNKILKKHREQLKINWGKVFFSSLVTGVSGAMITSALYSEQERKAFPSKYALSNLAHAVVLSFPVGIYPIPSLILRRIALGKRVEEFEGRLRLGKDVDCVPLIMDCDTYSQKFKIAVKEHFFMQVISGGVALITSIIINSFAQKNTQDNYAEFMEVDPEDD